MNLYSRYEALKKRVGGNREKAGFEFGLGATPEERMRVTSPSAWNERILSEVHFALTMLEYGKADCAALIDRALAVLEEAMDAEGVLTNSVCRAAATRSWPRRRRSSGAWWRSATGRSVI